MTLDQFNEMRFGAGMKVRYDGKVYDICSVDFQEQLIGIDETGNEDDPLSWKRCENCTLIAEIPDHRTEITTAPK